MADLENLQAKLAEQSPERLELNLLDELEERVPQLAKYYLEQFFAGKEDEALEGLNELAELCNIADQQVLDGSESKRRLLELQLLWIEAITLIEEAKNG